MKRLGFFFLLATLSVFGAISAAVNRVEAPSVEAPEQRTVSVTLYSAPKPAPKAETPRKPRPAAPKAEPVAQPKLLPKPKAKPEPALQPVAQAEPRPEPPEPKVAEAAPPDTLPASEPDAAEAAAAEPAQSPAVAGGAVSRPIDAYFDKLYRRISSCKAYPSRAKRFGIEGEVAVVFRIDGMGNIVETQLLKGSGSTILDRAAREIFEQIGAFEKPPSGVVQRRFEVTIEYYLSRR